MLDLLSYVLVPLYTLFFSIDFDPLTSNFSVIGNIIGKEGGFLLWGILLGFCLLYILSGVSKNLNLSRKKRHLVKAGLVSLFASIATPYLPDKLPVKAVLHILLAALSAFFLILYLFFASAALCQINPSAGKAALLSLGIMLIISLFLLLLAGIISSALEIFFRFPPSFMAGICFKKAG